jgi:tRNA (guanine-N7-)-methyltransferase
VNKKKSALQKKKISTHTKNKKNMSKKKESTVPKTTNDLGQTNTWTRLPIRTRPHRNPLSSNEDEHPDSPQEWQREIMEDNLYPSTSSVKVEFADIGCAFGGMLISVAPHFPNTLMLGLEIRSKVVEFAQGKTRALRNGELAHESKHHFNNVWFTQNNVMKFGDTFFERGQLKKLFFMHPDPHWKRNNVRRRIITPGLVQRYAHWLAIGGYLYTCSDVPELEEWMVKCLDESPQFERVSDAELESEQWFLDIVTSTSEDAQRAVRKKLGKNYAVHRRIRYDDKKLAPLF